MSTQSDIIGEFVKQVKQWYENNENHFAEKFKKAVENVQDPPAGAGNLYDWKKKSIDDLCNFFKEWYHWLPSVETGLEYIQKFSWLYYENDAGLTFVTTEPGLTMTKNFVDIRGEYMDSGKQEVLDLIKKWEGELGSQMDQFIIPEGGFKSFNEFFIREVKPGVRPIADLTDDSVVVAPADCVINMIDDDLTLDTKLPIKGRQCLNVKELLNNSGYAEYFDGGSAVSCILMPNTYHRYHSPVAGMVVEANDDVAGEYFGIKDFPDLVNKGDVGYGYDYSVFEHFRRGYLVMETANNGYVGMIPVGLNTIASVVFVDKFKHVTKDDKPVAVNKGEEIGYFKYGGSLNILLFEKGRFPAIRLLQGQRIGIFDKPS